MADEPDPPPGTFTFKRSFTIGKPPPDDPGVKIVEGPTRTFEWKLGPRAANADQPELEEEPATYYEALTGRRDPHREFFVTSRRLLNLTVTLIAIGIPVLLVAAGMLGGADLQTIVLLGVAGLVVGLMFKSTFPRTPFG